jgi:hypothetical protein
MVSFCGFYRLVNWRLWERANENPGRSRGWLSMRFDEVLPNVNPDSPCFLCATKLPFKCYQEERLLDATGSRHLAAANSNNVESVILCARVLPHAV